MSSPKYNKPTTIPTTTTHSTSQQQLPPPPKQIDQVGDYIIQEKIGQGSFATVYKAQHKVRNVLQHYFFFLHSLTFLLKVYQSNSCSKVCKKIKINQEIIGKSRI